MKWSVFYVFIPDLDSYLLGLPSVDLKSYSPFRTLESFQLLPHMVTGQLPCQGPLNTGSSSSERLSHW